LTYLGVRRQNVVGSPMGSRGGDDALAAIVTTGK